MTKSNNVNGKYLLLVPEFLGQLLQKRDENKENKENIFHPDFVSLLQSQIEHLDSPVDLGSVSITETESPHEDFSYWEFDKVNDLEVQRVLSIIQSIQIKLIYDTRNARKIYFERQEIYYDEKNNILILNVEKSTASFGPCAEVISVVQGLKKRESFSIYAYVSLKTKCIFEFIKNDFFADNAGGLEESTKLAIENKFEETEFKIEYFKINSDVLIMVHRHRLLELKVKKSFKHMFPNKDVFWLYKNTMSLSDFVTKQLRDFYFLKAIDFFYIQDEAVEEYLKIGRYLKLCDEISKLKEKIEAQNKKHEIGQNNFIKPFIFVCSSSGTEETECTIEYFKNNSDVLIMVKGPQLLEKDINEIFDHMLPNNDVILLHENTIQLSDFDTKQLQDLEAIDFFYIQDEAVEEYLKMGRYLKSCEEISKLKDKIKTLQKNPAITIENELIKPFIFVCSSSGTGKTQIPFTLDEPLLYFLYHTKSSDFGIPKGIRKYFINQSVELFKYFNMDLNNYRKLSEQKKNERSNFTYYTVGFLISFMRFVAENKRNSQSQWIRCQLQTLHEIIIPMTFDEGRKEIEDIKDIFKLENDFIIFMDECCVPDEEECINRFRFFRKIIRNLNLVLIVMGTNDDSANIVDCELSRKTRSPKSVELSRNNRSDESVEWCYIMFKLPKTSKKWMEEETKKFLERNKSLDNKIKSFITLVIQLCETERPLIASILLKRLLTLEITIEKIFFNFLEQIHQTFRCNKPDEENVFLTGQFAMISSTFWDPKHFKFQRLTSSIIKKHVAYLYGDPFLNEDGYFIEIHWNNSKLCYKNRDNFDQFIPWSTFPSFNDEPLTLMALSQDTTSCHIFPILVPNENKFQFSRISTINAFYEIKVQRAPFYTLTSTAMDGFAFEMLFNAACVAASHRGGFRNLSFTDWISNLIDELSLDKESFGENKWSTSFEKTSWDEIKIPYCLFGFLENAKVNENVEFLMKTFYCDIGVAYCHSGYESRDFYIKKLFNNEIIVTAECKCHKDVVKFPEIYQIVQKIQNYESKKEIVPSSVYIIFANRFDEIGNTSIKHYIEKISGIITTKNKNSVKKTAENKIYKNSLYKLKKINKQYSIDLILELDPLKPPFLLIDLWTINGDCDFLFQ